MAQQLIDFALVHPTCKVYGQTRTESSHLLGLALPGTTLGSIARENYAHRAIDVSVKVRKRIEEYVSSFDEFHAA